MPAGSLDGYIHGEPAAMGVLRKCTACKPRKSARILIRSR